VTGVLADVNEYRLVRDLLRSYDKRIRPSLNASISLNVTFGFSLSQIIDVVRTHNTSSNMYGHSDNTLNCRVWYL